ncbi:diacylglycerol kinase [Candidatus Berkelbacteria bacterium CG08_land_8_20_14_0_20_39_8]|uniref:Diacylglycerol kinase n=1 Tax=Candidatus Berkelbacteria bacterium CG08_land_8_20_14_0_20_39_8 TaxID=1974511 RepID=A0A2M6YCM8_9BACT|nr:MAG: diacylglycerol kinase [Candidatus Berkelbacteria bacterium CG08_land_8_20_14_0_20_39_8]
MTYKKMSLPKLFSSFMYASRGVINLLKSEQNARIHLIFAIAVATFAYLLSVTRIEAIILFFAVTLVIAMEIINTAIEKLLDITKPEKTKAVEFIKDAMAGAVLIASIIALVVTVLIFLPYFNKLLT